MAISAVTLAELSAGPHEVRPGTEQDVYFEATERARRLDVRSELSTSSTRSPWTRGCRPGLRPGDGSRDRHGPETSPPGSRCTRQILTISPAWITS